ncbi:MAG: 23S rRNA (uracil1939-C5)-methyltransferase [Gammaproteobacteria bacterium]
MSKFRTKKSNLQTFRQERRQAPAGTQVLTIIDQLEDGRGVGKFEGKIVFVERALKGEEVKVKFTKSFKKFDEAKTVKVMLPSNNRTTPLCTYFGSCGGCNLQHFEFQAQTQFKQKNIELRMANAELIGKNDLKLEMADSVSSPPYQYRHRARLSVEANSSKCVIGFKGSKSNKLVDITACEILLPRLNSIIPDLRKTISNLVGRSKILEVLILEDSNAQLFVQMRTGRNLLAIDLTKLIDFSAKSGVLVECNNLPDNSTYWKSGLESPTSILPDEGITFNHTLTDFTQINPSVNGKMLKQACQWLDLSTKDHVLDLFCGIGNFSLPIAKRVNHVHGYEISAYMVEKAEGNAIINELKNTSFSVADLFSHKLDFDSRVNKVILDPPRIGAEHVCTQLARTRMTTILYVSCNPASFFRDAKILTDGGYRLVKLGTVDMFPQTEHIELMGLFQVQ